MFSTHFQLLLFFIWCQVFVASFLFFFPPSRWLIFLLLCTFFNIYYTYVTYVENTAASNAESSSEQKPKGQHWKKEKNEREAERERIPREGGPRRSNGVVRVAATVAGSNIYIYIGEKDWDICRKDAQQPRKSQKGGLVGWARTAALLPSSIIWIFSSVWLWPSRAPVCCSPLPFVFALFAIFLEKRENLFSSPVQFYPKELLRAFFLDYSGGELLGV